MDNERYYNLHNKYIELQKAFGDTLALNQQLGSENVSLQESYANSEMNLRHITDLLEQAIEIIKEYIRLALQEPEEKDMIANIELFKKAEQFLTESE